MSVLSAAHAEEKAVEKLEEDISVLRWMLNDPNGPFISREHSLSLERILTRLEKVWEKL